MTYNYVVDKKHGPYYTIDEAIMAANSSWLRRLLRRFVYARILVKGGVYEGDVPIPLSGKYKIVGERRNVRH